MRTSGREIGKLDLEPLTRNHARFVEQALIDKAGLGNLSNKINSIRKGTKLYQEYLEFWNKIVWQEVKK